MREWIRTYAKQLLRIGVVFAVMGAGAYLFGREHPYLVFLIGILGCALVLRIGGGDAAYRLNSRLRKFDFWFNRIDGIGWRKHFSVIGYSPFILLVTGYLLAVVVGGPMLSDNGLLLIAVESGLLLGFVLLTRFVVGTSRLLHEFCLAALMVGAAATYFWAGPDAREADAGIYRHVFLWIVPAIAALTWGARVLALVLVRRFDAKHGAAWKKTLDGRSRIELHVTGAPAPTFDAADLLYSGVISPLQNWFLILFPVAVAVLMVPAVQIRFWGIVAAWICWMLVTLAGIHPRFLEALNAVKRAFFQGPALVVSAAVIGLAVARWLEFSYVAIVLNSTSSATVFWLLAAVYVVIWFFEFWIGYALCEELLSVLDPAARRRLSQLTYQMDPAFVGPGITIQATGRSLRIHKSRFVVVGKFPNRKTGVLEDGWEFYDRVRLFATIAERYTATAGGTTPSAVSTTAAPGPDFRVNDLRTLVFFYYAVLQLTLVVAVVVAAYALRRSEPIAELRAVRGAAGVFTLEERLFAEPKEGRPRRAVFVAASGGGTRAALYTTAVLQGLDQADALEDVVLFSGVSGGSAGIADYLLHRDQFGGKFQNGRWADRAEVMSAPYIDDVLRGLLETRLCGGTRMGTLLAESFERRMEKGMTPANGRVLATHTEVGVIFNTTLAATSKTDGRSESWLPADPRPAGARLIVTNLQGDGIFPQRGFADIETEYLPYVVVRDSKASLPIGAALSANFPPVFPNAAVDLTVDDRPVEQHWVTDGGASDNRGAVSLLYVLKHALAQEKLRSAPRKPPAIHVLIADSSALSLDFEQDRGVGSTFGAAEKYANQVMVDLLTEIQTSYKALGGDSTDFHVYYLPMPMVLRARGGVQTHWMLPRFITLVSPSDREKKRNLSGNEARDLILHLYHSDGKNQTNAREGTTLDEVWRWVEGEGVPEPRAPHRESWNRFLENLKKDR